jgi:outer membrane protein assembly factor BamD
VLTAAIELAGDAQDAGDSCRVWRRFRAGRIGYNASLHFAEVTLVLHRALAKSLLMFLVALSLSFGGCSWFKDKGDETEKWTEEKLYNEARAEMDAGSYSRAVELYEKLQSRHPFGKRSQQAQLDLAYVYYKQEESDSAIAACDRYIKLYPNSEGVDYAYYLKGLSHFNSGKGFVERYMPADPSQRDPGAAQQSFTDFQELIRRFPNSVYNEDARQRMIYLRNTLAQHEVNVAKYYMRREAYVAAANRARYVVENYQQAPAMPEALSIMARAYKVLGMDDLANDAIRVLEMNFPNSTGLQDAKEAVVR